MTSNVSLEVSSAQIDLLCICVWARLFENRSDYTLCMTFVTFILFFFLNPCMEESAFILFLYSFVQGFSLICLFVSVLLDYSNRRVCARVCVVISSHYSVCVSVQIWISSDWGIVLLYQSNFKFFAFYESSYQKIFV